MRLSYTVALAKGTFREWLNDNGTRLGAALAFYAALSLYPLIVITLFLVGFFLGREGAATQLNQKFAELIGPDGSQVIQILVTHTAENKHGILLSLINLGVLLFGASGVFGELHDAFNIIWRTPPSRRSTAVTFILDRLFSFAMVLAIGFLILVSLILSTAIHFIASYFTVLFPGFSTLLVILDFCVSFAITAALFALMFKILPHAPLSWKDAWTGALLTAILFDIGKFFIGVYLSHSSIMTSYGAAGSFVAFLVWIYYSAQILYIGAEFTKVSFRLKHPGKNAGHSRGADLYPA